MIKYNKLQIEDNYLIIDFEVEDKPYYNGNVTIKGIEIDTSLTFGTKGSPYTVETIDDTTHYTGKLFIPEIKRELLIITPVVEYTPTTDICGADTINKAAIYDKRVLLDKGMSYLKELGDTCNISKGFIDFILKQKALDMAITTCNYLTAVKYWKMLTMVRGTTLKGCGCHGK